jgi:hypothetical protein
LLNVLSLPTCRYKHIFLLFSLCREFQMVIIIDLVGEKNKNAANLTFLYFVIFLIIEIKCVLWRKCSFFYRGTYTKITSRVIMMNLIQSYWHRQYFVGIHPIVLFPLLLFLYKVTLFFSSISVWDLSFYYEFQ